MQALLGLAQFLGRHRRVFEEDHARTPALQIDRADELVVVAFRVDVEKVDALDAVPPRGAGRPSLEPVLLSFQLKLLWLSGLLPHLGACVECGADEGLVGYAPAAGGAVCASCDQGSIPLPPEAVHAIAALLGAPIGDAGGQGIGEPASRTVLAVITAAYEHHGGFRLRTLSA